MNAYSTVAATGSLSCFILGIYVLFQDHRRILNRLFFLMSVSLAGFIFIANLCYAADTLENLIINYRISSFFFGSYFALNLHFNLVFSKHKLKPWRYLLLYLPVPVVIFTTFADHSLFSDFIRDQNQWNFIPAYQSFGLYFYLIYGLSYMLMSIIIVEIYRRKTGLNKEKRQARIINTGYIITLLTGTSFAFLLPVFNVYWLSPLGPNTYIIYLFAIYYSVFKFKFLNLTTSIMADEIITHIGDMILLLGADLRITMINNKCAEVLGLTHEDLNDRSIFDIIQGKEDVKIRINDLKKEEKSMYCRIYYKKDNEDILTDSYISKIYDKFNDLTGFLVISRENKGRKQIQKAYQITDREFEVIELILYGLPNKIIGERLEISERTVETHCLHIYSKIGIKDRIELFTLANEFNLLPKN